MFLVVGAIDFLLHDAFNQGSPPKLRTSIERQSSFNGRRLVDIVIANDGGSTAASMKVEGTLKDGRKTVETISVAFDYIAAHSRAQNGMIFIHDASTHKLSVEEEAYIIS
ncbi:hypothetical protein [Azospirillum sp. SYSU D00513]|uniref:hypothetical protein n=1 Tax=Azospirillum sp. SYSU D00513 TaxID=2812561 RepID=UPI001A970798|nr:hypothetical protein [Azospirillum sp. SYSU D00513]